MPGERTHLLGKLPRLREVRLSQTVADLSVFATLEALRSLNCRAAATTNNKKTLATLQATGVKAEVEFPAVESKRSRDASHAYIRAQMLEGTQDWRGAEREWSRYLSLEDDSANGFLRRAGARRQLEDHPGALEDADRALAIAPSFDGLLERSRILSRLERHEEALKSVDAALARANAYDDLGSAQNDRGMIHYFLGDKRGAAEAYGRAIERGYDAYANRAEALLELGRLDEALADVQQALATDADDEFALEVQEKIRRRLGPTAGTKPPGPRAKNKS